MDDRVGVMLKSVVRWHNCNIGAKLTGLNVHKHLGLDFGTTKCLKAPLCSNAGFMGQWRTSKTRTKMVERRSPLISVAKLEKTFSMPAS